MEEYQTLSRCQKVKKILPKVLPILLLSVILPTADVGTDLVLITKLYKGLTACAYTDGMWRDEEEYRRCEDDEPDQYCNPERVSNNTVCGVSQYVCEWRYANMEESRRCQQEDGPDQYCTPERVSNNNNTVCRNKSIPQYYCDRNANYVEYLRCLYEDGPDQYCTSERISNKNNTVCRLKKPLSQYFCRYYTIWSSDWKDNGQCEAQGVNKYCSDPASNHNVCNFPSQPYTASSLLFFFLLNYVVGLVTCIRLEGRKWVPIITALFIFYPQYCKKLIANM